MKIKQISIVIGVVVLVVMALGAFYMNQPKDRCTSRDREIKNCVPAGKCGPTAEIDAVIDCQPKDYDHKFNKDPDNPNNVFSSVPS